MNHIDIKDRCFYWGNDYKDMYNIFYTTIYHNFGGTEKNIIRNIAESGWIKEEFLLLIKISKKLESGYKTDNSFLLFKNAIDNLEKNLDRYLTEAMIKSIIE